MSRSFGFTTFNPPADLPVRRTFPAASTTDLALANFTYLGCACLPKSGVVTDYTGSRGGLTGRRVSGQLRLFVNGGTLTAPQNGWVVEVVEPAAGLSATAAAAFAAGSSGRFSILNDWGNIFTGAPADYNQQNVGSVCDIFPSILFYNGKLYWDFYYSYNVTDYQDRFVGASVLNDASPGPGQISTVYGPWRLTPFVKRCGGFFTEIPTAFANAYCGGNKLGMGSPGSSGVFSSPFGGVCYAFPELGAGNPTSSRTVDTDIAATGTKILYFSPTLRMPLPTLDRKVCFWDDPGNHSTLTSGAVAGATSIAVADTTLFANAQSLDGSGLYYGYLGPTITDPSSQVFNYSGRSTTSGPGLLTGIPASGVGSIANSYAIGTFVLLGKYDNGRGGTAYASDGKWGPVTQLGPHAGDLGTYYDYCTGMQMVTTSTGKSAMLFVGALCDTVAGESYGSDPHCHVWYGANDTCPHGQFSTNYAGTPGPVSKTIVPYLWAYSFSDCLRVMQNAVAEDTLTPLFMTPLYNISQVEAVVSKRIGGIAGMFFDTATDRLWLMEQNRDTVSVPGAFEPLVHCWQLS